MIFKKKYTAKQGIVALITAVIALMNFLTLFFAIVSARRTLFGGGVEKTFENGFTLAFGECPVMIDDLQNWLPFYCLVHFIISLALIALLGLRFAVGRKPYFGKTGAFADFAALVMSLVYMISGISANSVASGFAKDYFTSYTLAYLPFILITVSIIALIAIKLYMPDDFNFGEKRKVRKK